MGKKYQIIDENLYQDLVYLQINLKNDSVIVYKDVSTARYTGDIKENKLKDGLIKYSGSGEIISRNTVYEFNIMKLDEESIYIFFEFFVCCDDTLEIKKEKEMFKISGKGSVVVMTPGKLKKINAKENLAVKSDLLAGYQNRPELSTKNNSGRFVSPKAKFKSFSFQSLGGDTYHNNFPDMNAKTVFFEGNREVFVFSPTLRSSKLVSTRWIKLPTYIREQVR
tara:strand:+ start:402 stop:1070 length:669 start_codon:yes stop_codon:yes gene_type:complete